MELDESEELDMLRLLAVAVILGKPAQVLGLWDQFLEGFADVGLGLLL